MKTLMFDKLYRQKLIEELKLDIEKGWDSELSKRSVSDIIASKSKKYNL